MDPIFVRKSIRKFTEQPVPEALLERLLRAGMQAPTAANQQGWEFVVVTDAALLRALGEVTPYAAPVSHAPAAIVIVENRRVIRSHGHFPQDCGAAAENILLEAVLCGLGGCWLGIAPSEEAMGRVKALLCLPAHVDPFCILALGYPAEEVGSQQVRYDPRKVHENRYETSGKE